MEQSSMGEIICRYRKEKGLTQKQLAELVGVTNKAISKWETGEGFPDIMSIPCLVQALGISADELFAISKEENQNDRVITINSGNNQMGDQIVKEHLKRKLTRKEVSGIIFIYAIMMMIARFIEVILHNFNIYYEFELVGVAFLGATSIIAYKGAKK